MTFLDERVSIGTAWMNIHEFNLLETFSLGSGDIEFFFSLLFSPPSVAV